MTGSSQSRQVLTMEMNESANSVSFGKKNGCYVNRGVGLLLGILFVSAMVATGLLVYYYAPQVRHEEDTTQRTDQPTPSMNTAGPVISPVTPTAETKKKMDVRLPRSIKPIRYLVKLQPFLSGNFSIMGYVEVEMEVLQPTNNVSIHIADLVTKNETITLAPMDNLEGPGVGIREHLFDPDREFYVAKLQQWLVRGKRYRLSMHFTGYLNDNLHGFYRSTYKDADGNERTIAATQFQPTDARRAFPCFDEPALKAEFEVYLGRQEAMTSVSNMPKVESMPIEGQPGWVWDHFNTSVPMSTYLVAFVISDFDYMEDKGDTLFRVWARKEAKQQLNYANVVGPQILKFFEDYFSIPYPLPKQDMMAIPDFSAGAMENWGLILYRETAMLYDPAVSSAFNKQRVNIVIAHELAHQWFGNLVTPSWWTDLWLNEGFASFMEYLGSAHAEPSWQLMEQFVITDLQYVFALDCLESSHPISVPVGHPDEINEIFDRISYSKGSSIIRMMNYFLTEDTFKKGLTRYLKSKAYDSAEQDDLWQFLTDAAHEDGTLPAGVTVKMIMDTWTLQMGYPVITVARDAAGTSAIVTQERFLLMKDANSTDTHDYKWWVPLTYTSQDNPDFQTKQPNAWLKESESSTTIRDLPRKDQWVIFNVQQTAYYRVNYDQNNWNLLVEQLKSNHQAINILNRAQIIDDAFDLARAGLLSYSTTLDINSYLTKETEYIPWSSSLSGLNYLESMFTKTAGNGAFKKYLLNLLLPLYKLVGFDDNMNDPHLDQFKRARVLYWACYLGYQDCVDRSLSLYRRWMADPSNKQIVSPNLKSTVYCTAIASGGEEEWNFAWDQYLASNVGSEKRTLLSAMGCTKELWLLSRYLEMAFTPGSGIRKQDAGRVFSAVAGNDFGKSIAWGYMRDKFEKIKAYYGSGIFTLPNIIEKGANNLNTDLELQELLLFQETYSGKFGTAKRAVSQAVEKTKSNIAWMKNNYQTIVEWLQAQGFSAAVRSE